MITLMTTLMTTLFVVATAYTTSPSENGGYTRTATGTKLRPGIVAVDPKIIPLSRKGKKVLVFIPKWCKCKSCNHMNGWLPAEDTGGAIKGNRIDICMPSRKEAMLFGRKTLNIKVKVIK